MLNKYGPLSIAMDASEPSFQSYTSGVYASTSGVCTTNTGEFIFVKLLNS